MSGEKPVADEGPQLFGSDRGPNPQELLFAALNSCVIVTFVVQASIARHAAGKPGDPNYTIWQHDRTGMKSNQSSSFLH
jgi:hypothetical protein